MGETSNTATAGSAGWPAPRERSDERVLVYRMLSEILVRIPDENTVNALRAPGVMQTFEEFGYDLGLSALADDSAEAATTLAVEYAWLFSGPQGHLPPFESLYRKGQPRELWSKSTQKVRRRLKALGLEPKLKGKVPDHIGVELDLMAHLVAVEANLVERGDTDGAARCREAQRTFLDEHLRVWVPTYAELVAERARLPLYREVMRCLVALLENDRELLGSGQPEEPDPT
jgi:TorA maturation chaperone TorD